MSFTLIHRRYERTSALTRTSGKALGIALLLSAGLLSATCGEDSSTPSTPEPSTPSPPSPPPTPDDHGSERGSATQVGVPSDTPGVLTALDADYFRLSVDRSGILTVYTSGTTDTAGRLDDASGLLLVRDSDSGVGNNFRIEHEVSSGTYFIGIAGQTHSIAGGYTLHVRFSAPPADDHGNDRASATQVGAPSDTPGALTTGDTDYFRISVRGSGALEVYTSGSTDTLGRLEDAGGSTLASNDDGGSGNNFRIERDVSAGTYYIRVAAFARSTTGNYTLHVRFAGLPEDDHGDYDNTATAVDVPSATRGELEHPADVDVFRFRLDSSGGRLTVETMGSTDVEGLLRGPNGLQERDDNSGAGSNFRIVVDNAPAGVYHAGVRGVGSGATGRYELRVRVDRGPSDDHGNDRASATRVGVPSDTSGALTAGDTDFFRIDTNGSGRLEVYTSGSIDTVGRLEDAGGSSLAENDDSGSGLNFRMEHDVSGGTYYVRVRGVSGSTVGDYTLYVRFEREDDSRSDLTIHSFSIYLSNGDTPLGPVEPGSRLELAVAVRNIGPSASPPTVVDYYRSNDSRITSGDFRVGADNTVSLSSGETQHLAEIVAAPSDPGTYYYGACIDPVSRESDTSNNCSTGVRLEVGSAPQQDDHGDSESTATEITVPSTTRGELERPDDVDVFRFRLDFEPSRITAYTTGRTDTVGELHRFGIFNSDDNSGDGLNFRIVVHEHFDSPGSYYTVYVRGNGSSTGPYELHVTADRGPAPDTDDHGDDRNDATPVAVPSDTAGVLTGGDTDYFTFSVRGSGILSVYSSGNTDTAGRLEDAIGSELATDANAGQGSNFRIERDVMGGTYYIRVTGQSGSTSGNYTLHIRFRAVDDHGDVRGSATPVEIPSDTQGVLTPNDSDYFRISVRAHGSLEVYTSGGQFLAGALEDPNGSVLIHRLGTPADFRIRHVVSPGIYFVRVYSPNDIAETYALHVRFSESSTPPPDDHGDGRGAATPVAVPSDTAGVLTTGDTDYFRISVSAPGSLRAYTSGNTDTAGFLYGPTGPQLATDADSGQGSNFRLDHDLSPGTYFVRVSGQSSSTEGRYTLHLRFSESSTIAADDHGDTRSSSTAVVVPSDTSGILTADDTDYFSFRLPTTGSLQVYTTGNTDTAGRLENANGSVLQNTTGGGQDANFRIERDVLSGTYYVRITGQPASTTGAYVVHVRFTEYPDDHGDSRNSATTVEVPSNRGGILTPGDVDYFRLSVNGPGTLQVYTLGGVDTAGRLESAGGTALATDADSGEGANFRVEHDVAAGTYFVRVSGQSSSTEGQYSLLVRFSGDDHGDTRGSATAVAIPSSTAGVLTAGDTDYFRINVNGSGSLQVYTTGNTDTTGRLENRSGIGLATDTNAGQGRNFRVERDVSAGTYFVRVTGQSSSTAGNYTLHVRFTGSPQPPADDHGDSRGSATTVAVPSDTPGALAAADTDYFRVSLSSPGTLLVYTTGNTDTSGRLENASGGQLATDTSAGQGDNFRVEHDVSAGTYFVRVTGQSSSTAGNYTLHVRFTESPPPPADDHGDSRGSATTVAVPSDTSGALAAADTDYFRINVSGPGTLLVYTTGNTDTTGRLENASGSQLAQDTDGNLGSNFRMVHDVSSGTYYVRVTGASSSTSGNYTLHVRFSEDDHGNSRGGATGIGVPGTKTGVLTADDTDYFRMIVSVPGKLLVYTSGNTDTTGHLEDASGSQLAHDADGDIGSNFRIVRIVSPGTYYVRVTGQSSSTTGDYTLYVRLTEDAHGNSRDDATGVGIPSDTEGVLTAGDTDYFRVVVARSGVLRLYTSGSTDTRGVLEDSFGPTLSFSDDDSGSDTNFRIERKVVPGIYYIGVTGNNSSTVGDYTLHVRFEDPDDHGDSQNVATGIGIPSDTAGVLTANDTDYFRVVVARSGVLRLYTSGSTDTRGVLEDSFGPTLSFSDDDSGSDTNFRIERKVVPGIYYIGVTGKSSSTVGDYTLHVRFEDPDDHGDSQNVATGIGIPSDTAGVLTANDTDYFRVIVARTGTLQVYTTSSMDTVGVLEYPLASLSYSDDDSGEHGNFRIEQTVVAGIYYVRVTGYRGSTGSYTLHVRLIAGMADQDGVVNKAYRDGSRRR